MRNEKQNGESHRITKAIADAAAGAGFFVTSAKISGKKVAIDYQRDSAPTIWDEESPKHVSKRGRLDFSVCHTRCAEIERTEKQRMKRVIKRAVPEIGGKIIIAHYTDHYNKVRPVADGYQFNVPTNNSLTTKMAKR